MENKIIFVNLNNFHSKKNDSNYFTISYIMNRNCVTDFITEDVFKELATKKLEFLKEYTAIFEINTANKQLRLANIK